MWTRGRDKNEAGKFAYTLYGVAGETIETVGGFETHTAADRAAEVAQRRVLFPIADQADALPEMTDLELLAALEA